MRVMSTRAVNPYPEVWNRFKGHTSKHELRVLHEEGLYRHYRVGKPGTRVWSWDITTWPGHLAITGDISDGLIFSREPDMLRGFFRTKGEYSDGAPRIDFRYWSQKLTRGSGSVMEYSPEKFEANVLERLDELYPDGGDEYENLKLESEWNSAYEHEARQWLADTPAFDSDCSSDWELTDWDWHFLLNCHAIALTRKLVFERKK